MRLVDGFLVVYVALAVIIGYIAIAVIIGYIAFHFISKFW